jgi:hypothetical protein
MKTCVGTHFPDIPIDAQPGPACVTQLYFINNKPETIGYRLRA